MNSFEAGYEKKYSGFNSFGKADITAKRKISQLIDSDWHHSWHWPESICEEWKNKVQESLITEMDHAKKRLKDLELAQEILDQIEV